VPRVLVVDDEDSLRTLLRTHLEEHGYDVIEASNGAEALDKVALESPDLVILDAMMPQLDGFGVLAELRKVNKFKNLPVIMLTAKTAEADRVRAFTAGANDFVAKPFHLGELLARMRSVLTTTKRMQQLVAMSTTDPVTGLSNWRYLESRLKKSFPAGETPIYGLLLELTGIETVLKQKGIAVANGILGSAGDIVSHWSRDVGDTQAFYLGISQILVLARGQKEDIYQKGAELQMEVHQACHFTPGAQGIVVHLAFVESEEGETAESFLARLEGALRESRIEDSGTQQPSSEQTSGPLSQQDLELAAGPGLGSRPSELAATAGTAAQRVATFDQQPPVGPPPHAVSPPPAAVAHQGAVSVEKPAKPAPATEPTVHEAVKGTAWEAAASMEAASPELAPPPDADELFSQTVAAQQQDSDEEAKRRKRRSQRLSMRMLSREFSGLRDLSRE
jgi:DNA-binding response OmpR family regulator